MFANNNAISSYLPDDLPRFLRAYPTVRMTLEERMSHEIVQAIAEGRADVGVVAFDADHPELEFYPYRQDELILLAPRTLDFGGRETVSFGDCLRHPFICLQQGAAMHTFLVNQAAALGGKLDVRVQVSGYRAIAKLVGSGAGLGVIPRSAVEERDLTEMHVLRFSEPWSIRNLRICVKRRSETDNVFRDKLVAVLRGVE